MWVCVFVISSRYVCDLWALEHPFMTYAIDLIVHAINNNFLPQCSVSQIYKLVGANNLKDTKPVSTVHRKKVISI